jgi:Bifunctional DNA primase/polymerase, N-terminal/Primase C terminal 1 (PriCT-1)
MQEIERLAERGWRLFPCARRSKVPLLKRWPDLGSSNVETLRRWDAEFPGCNWAVVTGKDSGAFVLDVDGEAGRASLAALEGQHGPLTVTLVSLTGRDDGGEHRWFRYPADRELRGSAGRLGEGLDIRAAGGYVIVPPSIHETGRPYQWGEPQRPVADAPAWLIELLKSETVRPGIAPPKPYGIFTEGERNDGLARYGGKLRRKGAELPELEEKLLSANARQCEPPLEEIEVCKIAASIARYPVGGSDPLELAWQAVQSESHRTRTAQFLGLCRHLQSSRPGLNIALPIERIAELMGVHWTSVSQYRQKAVRANLLVPAEPYIAHRRAGQYRFIDDGIQIAPKALTKPRSLTKPLKKPLNNKGLVRASPSENPHSESVIGEGGYLEILL